MEDTIVHEMIHAFDHCRFDVNWLDLRHHACSEVRRSTSDGHRHRINAVSPLFLFPRFALPIYQGTVNGLEKSVVDSTHSQNSIR